MTEMVSEVIEAMRVINQDKNKAQIKLNDLKAANCDPSLIRQVWVNLISNSIKYSSKKEKPLVEIGSTEAEGRTIYYVRDNGVGFDMRYYSKLFGVFQRLHKLSEFEGTGVGLALVHRIVTKHGGQVWAEAVIDEGATFYFTLN
jgi:two-component system sensor histidine kinase/response regulator